MLAKLAEQSSSQGDELWVNSSHHQSLSVIGDGLRQSAASAKEWHPERTFAEDAFSRTLFEELIAQATRWHERFSAKHNDFEAVR